LDISTGGVTSTVTQEAVYSDYGKPVDISVR